MINIAIDLGRDGKETTFTVYFNNESELFQILGQNKQLSCMLEGIELTELKQLRKEIDRVLKEGV